MSTLRENRIAGAGGAAVRASATGGASVTPHDSTENIYGALYIGGAGAGNLKVTTIDGSVLTFAGVTVGWFPVATKLVWSTGTDVTAIVGVNW